MKPLSPLYYIKENKSKCLLLMIMVFLSFGVYLGGLYVSNPLDNWQLAFEQYDNMVTITPAVADGQSTEFLAFVQEMEETGKVELLELGESSYLTFYTIMGFEVGAYNITFRTVEDFKIFCEHMNLECDFDNLQNGSLILSERFANNQGLKLGDTVGKMEYQNVYDNYTVDALIEADGYLQYYINEETMEYPWVMLLPKGIDGKELYDLAYEVSEEHKVSIYDTLRKNIGDQFETFNLLYMFVVILLSVILAVTINAAFVGMYQRRNVEFAVYRAIGIRQRRLIGKLVGELLWMDVIALVSGGAVFFLGLYLFNNLVLYPLGKYLRYYEPLALFGLLLCNVVVLLPLIVTRSRQLMKADICEY